MLAASPTGGTWTVDGQSAVGDIDGQTGDLKHKAAYSNNAPSAKSKRQGSAS